MLRENHHCVKFNVDFRILYEHPVCEGIIELNLDIAELIEWSHTLWERLWWKVTEMDRRTDVGRQVTDKELRLKLKQRWKCCLKEDVVN